jgi:hypothetical protein
MFSSVPVIQYCKQLVVFTGIVIDFGLWGSAAEKKLTIYKFFLDSLYR